MVNSRQIHYGFSAEHHECEFICVLLSPELLQGNQWFYQNYIEYVTEHPSCHYLYLAQDHWQASVLEKVDGIYRCFEKDCHDFTRENFLYFELIEAFASIMKILYENLPAVHPVRKREAAELASLKNMIAYVEEHFAERITLEDISLAGACCKSRCSLLFKKYLRDTPITYITKLRLRKSLIALLDSDLCVTDIAYEYGFGGASYYCESFRKYYGISPLKYKKGQLAGGGNEFYNTL